MKRKKLAVFAPLAIVGMAAFIALGGWVVKLLWNWLLPPLFAWHELTFWQAVGLLALCRILFGGLGMRGMGGHGMRRRMRENWEHLTPEEQERFREAMRKRWGFERPADHATPSSPEGA